jgi:hypothetical protein
VRPQARLSGVLALVEVEDVRRAGDDGMIHERRSDVGLVRVGVLNDCSETSSGERSIRTYPEHGHELDAARDGADVRGQPIVGPGDTGERVG